MPEMTSSSRLRRTGLPRTRLPRTRLPRTRLPRTRGFQDAASQDAASQDGTIGPAVTRFAHALSPLARPARVEHAGMIDAATLRFLADCAQIRIALLSPNGAVLRLGRTQRLASATQKRALIARDAGCVIPGCVVTADACQVHHVVPWTEGGPTDLDNLALLCVRHPVEITATGSRDAARNGWQIKMDRQGFPGSGPPPGSTSPPTAPQPRPPPTPPAGTNCEPGAPPSCNGTCGHAWMLAVGPARRGRTNAESAWRAPGHRRRFAVHGKGGGPELDINRTREVAVR